VYKNNNNDSIMALNLKTKALECYLNYDFEKALFYNKKSLDIFKQINDSSGISACYCNMAAVYKEMNLLDEAERLYFEALIIDKTRADKLGMAVLYNNIGELFHIKANYLKALYFYLTSLKLEKELCNKKGIADCYLNMGALFEENNIYDYALVFYNYALQYYDNSSDFYRIAQCYNNLGVLFTKTKSYYQAKDYFEKSLKIKLKNNLIEPMLTSLLNLGCLNILMNDTPNAIICFNNALKISRGEFDSDSDNKLTDTIEASTDDYFFEWVSDNLTKDNYLLIAENLHYKGMIHYYLGSYQKAIENFINSIELCENNPIIHLRLNNYYYMYKSFKNINDNANALFYADKYITLSDSNYKNSIKDFYYIVENDSLSYNFKIQSKVTNIENEYFYKDIWFYTTLLFFILLSVKLFVLKKG